MFKKKNKAPGEIRSYGDLADFIDRLLNDRLFNDREIDDFESIMVARKVGKKLWPVEMWRRCIVDIAGLEKPQPDGEWMHPGARPHLEELIPILRYLDERDVQERELAQGSTNRTRSTVSRELTASEREARPSKIRTFGDMADFLERLLEGRLIHVDEIDDFESNSFARKPSDKYWPLELWRNRVLDVAGAERSAPEGEWVHPSARPHLEYLIPILRYFDAHVDRK